MRAWIRFGARSHPVVPSTPPLDAKEHSVKFLLPAALILLLVNHCPAADSSPPEEGFVSLFDGKSLDGWKVGENAAVFQARDGMIVMECPAATDSPAHLFYVGDVNHHDFKNFDLKVDVMTFPTANSGIYFHTKYQEAGWPSFGIECQVDNTHADWRRTGSLYGIRNLTWGPEKPPKNNKENVTVFPKPPVTDNVWYTQEVIYQDGQVTVKLDGKTVLEYKLPQADNEHKIPHGEDLVAARHLRPAGAPSHAEHISKACFKNIRVKVLPD